MNMNRLYVPAMVLLLLIAPRAFAQKKGKADGNGAGIVIVSMKKCCPDEAWIEAETVTLEEFRALNFKVAVIDGIATGERERRIELGVLAEEKHAACALRIVKPPEGTASGVDLWITDRVTGKTVFKNITIEEEESSEPALVVALRVVELLRASLLEITVPDAPGGDVEPLPQMVEMVKEVTGAVEKPPGPVGLRLGAEVIGAPGGAGARGAVAMAVRWSVFTHLSLELDGFISLFGKDIKEEGASASFYTAVARVWSLWEIRGRGLFRPSIGAGGGLLIPWAKGSGSAYYEVRTDRGAVGYVGATAQLALALTRSFWLRFGVNAGASLPEVRMLFAGKEVASFGMPLIEGFFNLEVKIP